MKNHVRKSKKRNLVLGLIILVLLSVQFVWPNNNNDNYLAYGDKVVEYGGIDELESMTEYGSGLWYSPYVKIYSIGGDNRIAEISNYPRAYKDTTPHIYEKDESFIVAEGDLNHNIEGGEFVHMDSRGQIFRIGEMAVHYKGDSLPGAFPLWIESENIPLTPNPGKHVFPVTGVPGPIRKLTEVGLKVGNVYMKVSDSALNTIKVTLNSGKIEFDRKAGAQDKQIIRIRYTREF